MSQPITNRYDFVLIFDVKDGNPNGDPDAGNLPRIDPETGQGLVTDVSLKRKVRNYVQIVKNGVRPFDIYIKEKSVLGRAHFQAFNELGIDTGQEARKKISDEIAEYLNENISLPEGVSVESSGDDREIVISPTADKNAISAWIKSNELRTDAQKLISAALKDAKPRKPTREESDKGRDFMCKNYFDIRTFGAVLTLTSAPNCGQVRGPIQMTFARSKDAIVTLEHSITRMAVATEAEAEKQGGDNRTMGRKNTVPYGLYTSYGFISPHLAAQTGFSEDDLELFWNALVNMFEHDHSAARGMMSTCKLFIFKHDSALGNAASKTLFDMVKITRKDETTPPRDFNDYEIEKLDESKLPAGITLIVKP